MSDEHVVETHCNTCLFCNENNDTWNCKLGIASIFESQGFKKEKIDDNFVIRGRACWYYRNKIWQEAHKLNSFEEQKNKVMQEVFLRYTLIIYADTDKNINDIKQTILSIDNTELVKPVEVIIATHNHIKPFQIMHVCNTTIKHFSAKIPWSIEFITDNFDINTTMNVIYKRCNGIYIYVKKAGKCIDVKKINELNDIICRKMQRIIMATKSNGELDDLFFLKMLGSHVGWNIGDNMVDKVKEICKKEKRQSMLIVEQ